MSEYNGWSNYETWRVNLELFDGMTAADYVDADLMTDDRDDAVDTLADSLEAMAYETVEMEAKGWALDLAKSFLGEVNFHEIAAHMVDDYISENA